MPRDGSGVASAVPGSDTVAPNTTILSALHNSMVQDIYQLFNTAWPVAYGGSGAISASNFADLNNSTSILAALLKDIGGAVTAAGTATAITATLNRAYTAYGASAGQIANGTMLSLKMPNAATGAATLTLSAPSALTAKAIRRQGDAPILANDWPANATVQLRYDSAYNSAAGAWVLMSLPLAASPVGAVVDYAGASAPAGWLFCYGQNVSRTTYAALFTAIGTTFGVGDGSTTFGLPDLRGRVIAGKDDMGGSAASRLTSGGQAAINGATLGAAGGAQDNTLDPTRIPSHTHVQNAHTHQIVRAGTAAYMGSSEVNNGILVSSVFTRSAADSTNAIRWEADAVTATNQNAGGGGAHNNVQPTLVMNKIIFAGV